jgi:hypothetical protein
VLFSIWAPVEDIGCGTEKLITAEPPKVRIVHIRIHQSPLYDPMRHHFNSAAQQGQKPRTGVSALHELSGQMGQPAAGV